MNYSSNDSIVSFWGNAQSNQPWCRSQEAVEQPELLTMITTLKKELGIYIACESPQVLCIVLTLVYVLFEIQSIVSVVFVGFVQLR